MAKTARVPGGLVVVLLSLVSVPAQGQRVQFPSMLPAGDQPSSSPGYANPASPSPTYTTPTYTNPASPGPTYGSPAYTNPSSPRPTYTTPTYTNPPSPSPTYGSPAYTNPSSPGPAYGAPPQVGPGPTATFNGTILPPPSWDPYATPSMQQPTLLPQDPYYHGPAYQFPAFASVSTMRKFLQEVRATYTWMPKQGEKSFVSNDMELSSTFAFPFFYNQQTPLLVTPGFAAHFLAGPVAAEFNLPPQVYDAYLEAAWNPQVTPWFGGELAFRIGVYSDFNKVDVDSLRFPSKGLAVLSFSPSFQIKFGAMYLDRLRVRMLPAGGIVWTPNSDFRFDILFPNPKITRRLTTYGTTEWWLYGRGEYGGGDWAVTRDGISTLDRVNYNDLRAAAGVEFKRPGGLNGLFEVGVAFDREIRYISLSPTVFRPDTTVFLRTSLAY